MASEGVERDAYGQENVEGCEIAGEEGAQTAHEEVGVLEIEERQEVGDDDDGEPDGAPTGCLTLPDGARELPRQRRGDGQQEHEHTIGLEGEKQVEGHHIDHHGGATTLSDEQIAEEEHHKERQELQRAELERWVLGGEETAQGLEYGGQLWHEFKNYWGKPPRGCLSEK